MTVLARRPTPVSQTVIVPSGLSTSSGNPIVGQEYFKIFDQNNFLWSWWIDWTLAPTYGTEPENPFDQLVTSHLIPYWIMVRDVDQNGWYLYPEVDGSYRVEVSQPPVGNGITEAPPLRVRGGTTRYKYTVTGGALDVVAA